MASEAPYDFDNDGAADNNVNNCGQWSCDEDVWDLNSNGCIDRNTCDPMEPRCCPAPFDPNNPPLACDMSQTVDGEAIVRDDITDGSWMADYASIVPGCTNSDYTGAVHDWTRFFWNLTTDENLSPTKIADILEEAGADDWCATGNTPAGCSPGSRIQSACGPTREDCQTEYFNQQHNGVFP
jgi:hypothetical protein